MTVHESDVRSIYEDRTSAIFESAKRLGQVGLAHCRVEDDTLDGRFVTTGGQKLANFGSCSYLGLEMDRRVKRGACEAVWKFGTQFSSSRSFMSLPLYSELEEAFRQIVGHPHIVIAPTTSLGHQSALPLLVQPGDAVLYDVHVHASVQAVLPTLRAMECYTESLPHNRLDMMEQRAHELAAEHGRVFYLCDGIYSMHGDAVDVPHLRRALENNPCLHVYVDDAHGIGWSGTFGQGHVLGQGGMHPRMTVILGLAKSFAAGGAVLVLPDAESARRIFVCGTTMIFSGPLQPAQLGAALASAEIHRSTELAQLQAELVERIALFDETLASYGVPVYTPVPTPIRFVPVGDPEVATRIGVQLREAGYFVHVAVFPAVSRSGAGIRVMLNRHLAREDVEGAAGVLARGHRTLVRRTDAA